MSTKSGYGEFGGQAKFGAIINAGRNGKRESGRQSIVKTLRSSVGKSLLK